MNQQEDRNREIFEKAAELVDTVGRQLQESERFFDDLGLDPEKVRATVGAQIEVAQDRQAQEAFREDMEAVEREVAEEAARQSFQAARPAGNAPRPRRNMI